MKWRCRMLETLCASIVTGAVTGSTGEGSIEATPAAVGPINTILSRYLSALSLPEYTS